MSQDYDKIIKENIEGLLPALMERVLGLRVRDMERVPFDVQVTLERRPDFVVKVEPEAGPGPLLLQIEFQASNDAEMAERMHEYAAFLRRKHRLPLRQYVLYFGQEALSMPAEISEPDLWFRYHLFNLRDFDYQQFLTADKPEEVVLAVLCHFRGEDPPGVIRQILRRLQELAHQGLRIDKYIQQLEVLSHLRNLHQETVLQAQKMAITYDITKDLRYQEGLEQGLEKGLEQGLEKGLEQGLEKGLEQGLEQGLEKGLEQGLERGEAQRRTKVIVNMLRSPLFQDGLLSLETIAELAGASLQEVESLFQQQAGEGTPPN